MLIILALYGVLVWLIFFRFKWLPFNWVFGTLAVLGGVAIGMTFIALLNAYTPSGRVEVMGKVVEVTPNVAGQIVDVPVERNVLVKAGTPLFQIDRTPYQYKLRRLEAALAEARQKAKQLEANLKAANAEVESVTAQRDRAEKRRQDIETLAQRQGASQFNAEDTAARALELAAQLEAARARRTSAELAATSLIDGENTAVAQLQAQVDDARWDLDQTTVRAPADGYVTASTLVIGSRVTPLKSAMAFIPADEIELLGVFPQNGLRAIRPGARVRLALSSSPGRLYEAQVREVMRGVGEGQFSATGSLARVSSIAFAGDYPVRLTLPDDLSTGDLRLGIAGPATVFSTSGPIALIASVLLTVKAWLLYL